jgi:hypothetical protein
MKPALHALRPALAKLIRLLASDVDGEVLAAVRALGRALKASGCDIHDLAGLVETPAIAPSTQEAGFYDQFHDQFDDDDDETEWRFMLDACTAHVERFTSREQQLFQTLQHWRGTPTERQLIWLRALFERVRRVA